MKNMKSAAVVVFRGNKLAIFKNMQKGKVWIDVRRKCLRPAMLRVTGLKRERERESEKGRKNVDHKKKVRHRLNRTKHLAFMGRQPLSSISLVSVDGAEESSRNGFFKSTISGVFSLSPVVPIAIHIHANQGNLCSLNKQFN